LAGLVCLFLPDSFIVEGKFSRLDAGVCVMNFTNEAAYLFLLPVGRKMWLLLSEVAPESGLPE